MKWVGNLKYPYAYARAGRARHLLERHISVFAVLLMIIPFSDVRASLEDLLNRESYQTKYALTALSDSLTFNQPVAIERTPDPAYGIFIVEREGRIYRIPDLNSPTKQLFLDLSTTVSTVHDEAGLLGLAFHPQYPDNGRFFVYWTSQGSTSYGQSGFHFRLSEFSGRPEDDPEAILTSESPLIEQMDPDPGHNAGTLRFGRDGYLYFSVGDTGPPHLTRRENMQPVDDGFFGAIFRIDVDNGAESLEPNPNIAITGRYKIPRDNPLVGKTSADGIPVNTANLRTEIFAYGFRNPWKFAFHPTENFLVAGDVGSGAIEELDIVRGGENFGWPYFEGTEIAFYHRFKNDLGTYIEPWFQYPHGYNGTSGNSITAGHFYQGNAFPELKETFIFGDWSSGNIWSLPIDPDESADAEHDPNDTSRLVNLGRLQYISSFGEDPRDNEILIANSVDGKIYKIVVNSMYSETQTLPEKLSDSGVFESLADQTPLNELNFYEPVLPFWSDGFVKKRWILLPQEKKIAFEDDGTARIPDGTLFVKHFDWEDNRFPDSPVYPVETRFLLYQDNQVYGATYEWNENGTDASLVSDSGATKIVARKFGSRTLEKEWLFPSRSGCILCHNKPSGQILGFRHEQLNNAILVPPGTDQLRRLAEINVIESQPESPMERISCVPIDSTDFTLKHRFKSYTASNCRACHTPGGVSQERWDARLEIPIESSGLINIRATPPIDPAFGRLIDPVYPEKSELLWRIGERHVFQMPPIGSFLVDQKFVDLTRNFAASYPPDDWRIFFRENANHFESVEIEDGNWYFAINGKSSPHQNSLTSPENFMWAFHDAESPSAVSFNVPDLHKMDEGGIFRVGLVSNPGPNQLFTGYEFSAPATIRLLLENVQIRSINNISLNSNQAAITIESNSMRLNIDSNDNLSPRLRIGAFRDFDFAQWKFGFGFSNYASASPQRFSLGNIHIQRINIDSLNLPQDENSVLPALIRASSEDGQVRPVYLVSRSDGIRFPLNEYGTNYYMAYGLFDRHQPYDLGIELSNSQIVHFSADHLTLPSPDLNAAGDPGFSLDTLTNTKANNLISGDHVPVNWSGTENLTNSGNIAFADLNSGQREDFGLSSELSGEHQTIHIAARTTDILQSHQILKIRPLTPEGFSIVVTLRYRHNGENITELIVPGNPASKEDIILEVKAGLPISIEIQAPWNKPFALVDHRILTDSPFLDQSAVSLEYVNTFDPAQPHVSGQLILPASNTESKISKLEIHDENGARNILESPPFAALVKPAIDGSENSVDFALITLEDGSTHFAPVEFDTDINLGNKPSYVLNFSSVILDGGAWMNFIGNQYTELPWWDPVVDNGQFMVSTSGLIPNAWDIFHYTHPNLLIDPFDSSGQDKKLTHFWYSRGSGLVQVRPLSPAPYRISIYAQDVILDGGRTQNFTVIAPKNNQILHQSSVADFQNGELLTWTVSGDINIQLTSKGDGISQISGIFVDNIDSISSLPRIIRTRDGNSNIYIVAGGQPGSTFNIESSPTLKIWESAFSGTIGTDGVSSPLAVPQNSNTSEEALFYRLLIEKPVADNP